MKFYKLILFMSLIFVLMALFIIQKNHGSNNYKHASKQVSVLTPYSSIIKGILKADHNNRPLSGVELYLARHIGAKKDAPIYGLDPGSAPHTITEDDGSFVFVDVPEGRYVIVIWNPFNSFVIIDQNSGKEIVIEAKSNKIYDIGVLFVPQFLMR